MTLPTSGIISMSMVGTELSVTGQISLGQTDVRKLAGKTAGQISMSDLYGKAVPKPYGDYISGGPVNLQSAQYYGYSRDRVDPQFPSLGTAEGFQVFGEYQVITIYSNSQQYFFFGVDYPGIPPIPYNTVRVVLRGNTYDIPMSSFTWIDNVRQFVHLDGGIPSLDPAGTRFRMEFLNK